MSRKSEQVQDSESARLGILPGFDSRPGQGPLIRLPAYKHIRMVDLTLSEHKQTGADLCGTLDQCCVVNTSVL